MRTGLDTWKVRAADFPAAGIQAEKLQFLVNYAVLAPSKYNAQPWLFEICGDSLDIICDRNWAFRETDPEGRELILSCGAALENLGIAAKHFGHAARIEPFPWPGDRYLLARVRLGPPLSEEPETPVPSPAAKTSPRQTTGLWSATEPSNEEYFRAMNNRCTSRRPFWPGAPPEEVLQACAQAAARHGAWLHFIRDRPTRQAVGRLVARGDREQMANKALRRELLRWVRWPGGKSKDGFTVSRYGLPGAMSLLTPGFSLLLWMLNLGSLVAAHDRRLAQNAPILAVLGTEKDQPEAWLSAGQAMERVLLRATAAGLSASFFNQPIEVPHLRAELGKLIGRNGFPQVLLRLGYGKPARHTPRRPASEVVI
jgi:hypothetical protein